MMTRVDAASIDRILGPGWRELAAEAKELPPESAGAPESIDTEPESRNNNT